MDVKIFMQLEKAGLMDQEMGAGSQDIPLLPQLFMEEF